MKKLIKIIYKNMWKPVLYKSFGQGFSSIKFNTTEDRDAHFKELEKDFPKMNIKKTWNIWITVAPIILPNNKNNV